MKRKISVISLICIISVLLCTLLSFPVAAAANIVDGDAYTYEFTVKVDNPCNTQDMDKDAVNILYFEFFYTDLNGFGSEKKYKYDMSWSNGQNKNASFLKSRFFKSDDDDYVTYFTVSLAGKLSKMHIKLNMDGGERLSFSVDSITCNGTRINNNTDYVSSAYSDSEANIYCSMETSVINFEKSSYFDSAGELTQNQLTEIINNASASQEYQGMFKDQYDAVIDLSVLKKCILSYDGGINQQLSHADEESMYKYTVYVNVSNPINLTDADYDEVETFFIDFCYIDSNGYGKHGKYTLDMSFNKELNRNLNPRYLALFQRSGDSGYKTSFDVWVPGYLEKVECKLNMSGEKLSFDIEKIMLNSLMVNTSREGISSTYYDSDAEIICCVPDSGIVTDSTDLSTADYHSLKDQFGALISSKTFSSAKENVSKFLYRFYKLFS